MRKLVVTDNLDRLSGIMSLISLASNQLRTYSTLTMSAVRLLASECGIHVEIRLDLSSSERGNGPAVRIPSANCSGPPAVLS
jgi:hypothetical protein